MQYSNNIFGFIRMVLLLLFQTQTFLNKEMVNMGENEWVNGYLEAILDVGSARNGKRDAEGRGRSQKKSFSNSVRSKLDEEMLKFDKIEIERHKIFTPTRYFVEQVVIGFDEADLHRTWTKMIATRNSRHRNNRLENMCWRIWHLARRKKQMARDAAQKLVQRRFDREKARSDAAHDLSDLSEGERDKGESNQTGLITNMPRISSDAQLWPYDKSRQLYIVLISLHGLVRGENMELGRDSDTGGQVKYVVELARALANMEGIHRVDLLTRQITSPEVDSTYSEPIEMLSCSSDGFDSCGAYLVRIPCGPSDKYIPKESLWPYIGEFVDGALSHIVNMARALGEQVNSGKPAWPYVIHGHYADAGEVAARLSAVLNVPMVLTGHSLGRNKLEQLLKQGRLSREDIDSSYNIIRRIEAEELGLDSAEIVVTSTKQEIEEQWGLYDGFDLQLERKLRIRRRRGVSCLGRYMPRMVVIQPGMDFSSVAEELSLDSKGDLKSMIGADKKRPMPPIWSEIVRFFTNPHKPMILALSRPDPKKNITTLLKAFGECQPLRELANLTLILGNRDNIEEMSNSSSSVLTTVLKLVDKYDLYGQVAYPKHHKQPEVPEIYRLAAKTKGVFINPALVEPFGLTLIEAAAYGLPIVATKNGGPVDILKALNNGLLVDPHDENAISDALLKLVADKNLWKECRRNGLKNIHKFSWLEHCRNYLSQVEHCRNYHPTNHLSVMPIPEEPLSESLRGIEDLSLKFSIDVDVKANGEPDDETSNQQKIIDFILQQKATSVGKSVNIYCPGRRKRLCAIAVDSYNSNGGPAEELPLIIKNVIQVSESKCMGIGFVLLTGMSLQETKEMLGSEVKLEVFDALVCSSGSEMCYPWRDLVSDQDYESHIEYRWPGENVKAIVTRLASVENDDVQLSRCGSRCYSYSIKPKAKVHKIDDLRQRLCMRGLRCNMVYTHAASKLNVIPLFASRAQALRYLSVRWTVDMEKVILFMGERGDTDHEDLLGGLHKTVILRDSVVYESEINVHSEDSMSISRDNKRVTLAEGFEVQHISKALDFFHYPI